MIELKNISKRFGPQTVLDKINLEIKKGEIHALLGTNGAGKSTLIKNPCWTVATGRGENILRKSHFGEVLY